MRINYIKNLLIIFSIWPLHLVVGQNIDTVFINEKYPIYIVTDYDIHLVDLGERDTLFDGEIAGNTLKLETSYRNWEPAVLSVKSGDDFYYPVIAHKDSIPFNKRDYRFSRKTKISDQPLRVEDNSTPMVEMKNINVIQRLGILKGDPSVEFKGIARVDHKMVLQLANMMQDEDFYYLKLVLHNKSKETYIVDYVDLTYIENSTDPRTTHQAVVIDKIEEEKVNRKEIIELIYAIEKYKLGDKGTIRCTLREKEGSRMLSFEFDYKEMLNSKQF